jgi:hypothetical protein
MRQIRQPSLVQIHGRAHGGTVVPRADLPRELRWPASAFARTRQLEQRANSVGARLQRRYPVTNASKRLALCSGQTEKVQEAGSRTAPRPGGFTLLGAPLLGRRPLLEGLRPQGLARRASIRAFRFRASFRHDLARRRHHQVGSSSWSVFASLPSNTARFWSAARRTMVVYMTGVRKNGTPTASPVLSLFEPVAERGLVPPEMKSKWMDSPPRSVGSDRASPLGRRAACMSRQNQSSAARPGVGHARSTEYARWCLWRWRRPSQHDGNCCRACHLMQGLPGAWSSQGRASGAAAPAAAPLSAMQNHSR